MTHLHKSSGMYFQCGELMETSAEVTPDGTRKTFDITVITLWDQPGKDFDMPPIIVGYYFGEYNPKDTDYYIDQWLKDFNNCKDIIDAYYITNEDVLDDNWRAKALGAICAINKAARVLQNNQAGGTYNE